MGPTFGSAAETIISWCQGAASIGVLSVPMSHVRVHVCLSVASICMWRPKVKSSVFLSPTLLFEACLQTNPELSHSTRLAGQQTPPMLLLSPIHLVFGSQKHTAVPHSFDVGALDLKSDPGAGKASVL